MNTEKRIRNEAKALLSKGNWSKALGVFFILFASVMLVLFIQSLIVLGVQVILTPLFNVLADTEPAFSLEIEDSMGNGIITTLSGLLGNLAYALIFLLIFPIFCGVRRFFYLTAQGKEVGISEVFYYLTNKLKSSVLFGLRYGLLCCLKLLPCIIPALVFISLIFSGEYSTQVNSLLTVCVFITGIAGIALWILWTSRQSLSMYLFIEDDTKPSAFYVRESEKITAGPLNNSMRKLMFSFFGWFLLALTGVGMLYFVPCFEMSVATSAKWIIKLQKEE